VSDVLFADFVAALDLVVFERMPDGVFLRLGVGQPPAWFAQSFRQAAHDKAVTLAEAFPFLENFLVEAEELWNSGRDGRTRSEPFVVNLSGGEIALVATALAVGHRRFLIIELPHDFEERRSALQRARDQALAREQLVSRIAEALPSASSAVRLSTQLLSSGLTGPQEALALGIQDHVTKVLAALESLAPRRPGVSRRS
jgi:hypothetical protein